MILKSLTLKNFRKFKATVIDFPDGVTGIIGLNGVGKSTIFEAIAWTLFGPVAARTSSDQIKRTGAEPGDACRVELEFIFDEDTYRVVREMAGKNQTPKATVVVNGKVAANSAETASKYIQKKLGMDFKSFFTSIYAKQKELNVLSSMNASERRPLILKMLGIDALDDVIKEIRADKKNKDAVIEKLAQDLVDDAGNNKIELYKTEKQSLEEKQKKCSIVIQHNKEMITGVKKELKQLEKKLAGHKKDYEEKNQQKEKLSEKKTLFEKQQQLRDEIYTLQRKIDERNKIISDHQQKLKPFETVEQDIIDVEKKLERINIAMENLVKKIEQKKTLIENKEKEAAEIEVKKKKIEHLGPKAECPTCERKLDDQYNILVTKFDEEQQRKHAEIDSLGKQLKKEQQEHEGISRQQEATNKKRQYLHGLLREKEKIDTTIRNQSSEIKQETKELNTRKKYSDEIKPGVFDQKQYEQVKKQVEKLYTLYQSHLDMVNEQKDQLTTLQIDLGKKEGDKNLIQQRIQTMQQLINEQEKHQKRIHEEKQSIQQLNMLAEVMSSFRTYLISRIRPMLSSYASDFFDRLTDGKYHEVELDENYNLMVYDDGNSYNIERFSGGEEDLANLCLRLAISEVITERAGGIFNFIILDEIFGSQDLIRRQNIMKALNSLSSKFRQIFLITHIEEVKHYVENTMSVSEDEQGISMIQLE